MTAPLPQAETQDRCPRWAPGRGCPRRRLEGRPGDPRPHLPPGLALATTYLAPDLVDDGDEQQDAAQREEDILGVVQHAGHQHQLGVEGLQGLAFHRPALGMKNDKRMGWGHARQAWGVDAGPRHISISHPFRVSRLQARACDGACGQGASFSSFSSGPHDGTTFPRLPCSWARPVITFHQWDVGPVCYNFLPIDTCHRILSAWVPTP